MLDLPDLVTGNDEPSSPKPSSQDQPQITTTVPVLPDLDDLFAETESPIKPSATVTVPELPDLDDLFWKESFKGVRCSAPIVWTQHMDLHSHSTHSDGQHDVALVARLMAREGVRVGTHRSRHR